MGPTRATSRCGRVYDTPVPEPDAQNRMLGFFSKQSSRASILLGLGIHFSIWWALSVLFWVSPSSALGDWKWSRVAWVTLVAPLEVGIVDLQASGYWRMFGVAGLLLSGCLLGLTVRSATTRKRGTVLLAHMFVALYCFSSFLLIDIGI